MYHILQNFWLAYLFDAVIGAMAGWLFYKLFSEYGKASNSPKRAQCSNEEIPQAQTTTVALPLTLAAELEKYRSAYQQLSDERIALDEEWQKRYRLYKEFCDDRIATLEAEVELLRSKPTDEERAQLYEQLNRASADKEHWHALYQESENQLAAVDQEAAALRSRVTVIDALEKDRAQLKLQITEWASCYAEQGRELAECHRQIEKLSGNALPPEPQIAADWSYQSDETIRMKLAAAQAEIAQLRSHLSTASFLQDQWRRRWHESERQLKQVQQQVAQCPDQALPDKALQTELLNRNGACNRTAPRQTDERRAIA
ncbi:MAG: hypothetical protein FJ145_16210 [Deltaproteobacteria bacterium]|nr:hypothetical protein [Deltaproteobacteria bacterium]